MNDMKKAKMLWAELGDIPTNEDMEIETQFLHFEVGTDAETIWHWFEEEFDLSVAEDLMYAK